MAMPAEERTKVLWKGSRGSRGPGLEFTRRGLALEIVDGEDISEADLVAARGIVYAFGEQMLSQVREMAELTARKAMDHGLAIFVLASEDEIMRHAQKEMSNIGVAAHIYTRTGDAKDVPDHEIAQFMLMADPKLKSSATLEIERKGEEFELQEIDELLLRRAFSDCVRISVSVLGGGRTAETFMVEATFAGSEVGPRPLPFFVKLGKRDSIKREVERYASYATHYIPFHLRPNLDPPRCLLGFGRAILVGNFVERAEPLWDLAEKGKAHAGIHSLFDATLAGWRLQGFEGPYGLAKGSVACALTDSIFKHERVQPAYVERAKALGLRRSPKELWECLLGASTQEYYRAPMHGDLHPDNVFIRGGDAILIDLASVQSGPLSGDLACLETFFAFEVRKKDRHLSFDDWRASVDRLYDKASFVRLPPPMAGSGVWASRWNCARQVRMIALPTQACETEYLSAVAVYLLRRTMYTREGEPDELLRELEAQRRSYALVVADRLVTALTEMMR